MFTGLIERTARIVEARRLGNGLRIQLEAQNSVLGESIAVNGCCLTVCEINGELAAFDISPETLERTKLAALKSGDMVNIERSLKPNDRLGGHFVSGHIDAVGSLRAREPVGDSIRMRFSYPHEFKALLVHKGSIAVDGVSLTINQLDDSLAGFEVMIIPHTHELTTLKNLNVEDTVNLEFDMIGKYALRATEIGNASQATDIRIPVSVSEEI